MHVFLTPQTRLVVEWLRVRSGVFLRCADVGPLAAVDLAGRSAVFTLQRVSLARRKTLGANQGINPMDQRDPCIDVVVTPREDSAIRTDKIPAVAACGRWYQYQVCQVAFIEP